MNHFYSNGFTGLHFLTKCSVLFNLVINPFYVIFVAADDGQGNYLGDFIAVYTFNKLYPQPQTALNFVSWTLTPYSIMIR